MTQLLFITKVIQNVNVLCRRNVQLLNVNTVGAYSNNCTWSAC